jgi:hypothetical protein
MDGNRIHGKLQVVGRWPWGAIFGFLVVGLYIFITIIAITRFPHTVSPLDTYLSMLGNADISPDGAIFYNLAVILAGLAEILFFIGIYAYYSQYGRRWILNIGLFDGLINGISVSLSGVYAEHTNMDAHVTWSYLIFFSLIPVLLAFSLALRGMKETSRWVILYGFLVCAIDIIFLATVLSGGLGSSPGSIMEWVSVFSYLFWVVLISLDLLKRSRAESRS